MCMICQRDNGRSIERKIDAGLVDEKWVPKIIGIKNYSKNHMM